MTADDRVAAALARAKRPSDFDPESYVQAHDDRAVLAEAYTELLESLEDVIGQACYSGDGLDPVLVLDSMALSAYADAMRLLAKHGRLTITEEHGRRVIGTWTQ